ncbi:MAG: ABC transporter substrate-binding protein [Anaerolineaceae bacterium]
MNNKPFFKRVSLLLLIVVMAGCIPMSTAGVDRKAAVVAEKVIKESEKPKKENKESKKTKYKLADEQVLNLSIRSYSDLEPNNAYGEYFDVLTLVLPGLTRQDAESSEFLPVLAKSWEVSEDGLTWTFTLRDDVPWVTYNTATQQVEQVVGLDGEPAYVTAQDIQTRIMQILDPFAYAYNFYLLYSIAGAEDYFTLANTADTVQIEVPSSTELVIHLTKPDASFLSLTELSMFSAFPSWLDVSDTTSDTYFYGPYVATTPMTVDHLSVSITRNPFWVDTKGLATPILDEININLQYDLDVLSAFRNGEIDAVSLNESEYQEALTDAELAQYLVDAPGDFGYYVLFNNTNLAPISDVEVRRAMASVINKTTLLDGLEGFSGSVLQGFIPDALREESFEGISYNPEVDVTLDTQSSAAFDFLSNTYSINQNIVENLSDIWKEQFGWTFYPFSDPYTYLLEDLQNIYNEFPGVYTLTFYLEANGQEYLWKFIEEQESFVDVVKGNWDNTEFNSLSAQAQMELDGEKRAKLYDRMEEILVNEDVMIIPLFWEQQHWLIRSDVGAEIRPVFQQLENWARIIP